MGAGACDIDIKNLALSGLLVLMTAMAYLYMTTDVQQRVGKLPIHLWSLQLATNVIFNS